jgi:glutaredoxin
MITDEGVKEEYKKILGKKIKTVPQVTIDGKLLGGYTEVERFLRSLH